MIDKELIKQKKQIYGDNFEDIARVWSEYIRRKLCVFGGFKLKGEEVAEMMLLMKECRIDVISEKLEECEDNETADKLKEALEDSLKDRDNYEWIAKNYKEYKRL